MTAKHFVYLILMPALVAPCFAGDKVVVDYNKDFSFASVKTYAWQEGTPADPLISRESSGHSNYSLPGTACKIRIRRPMFLSSTTF